MCEGGGVWDLRCVEVRVYGSCGVRESRDVGGRDEGDL